VAKLLARARANESEKPALCKTCRQTGAWSASRLSSTLPRLTEAAQVLGPTLSY